LGTFGLKIDGIANLTYDCDVISVSHPFIFDCRLLPQTFMGLDLRSSTYDLPSEFNDIRNEEYIWAYQKFELFVDRHSKEIQEKLNNHDLTKTEMLDALCFGDFERHKTNCMKWETDGKIPVWK